MAEQTPEFVLILKTLTDLRQDVLTFSADFKSHVDKDMEQFQELHKEISRARGAAMVIIPIISAFVSVIIGYLLKHF